MTWLSIKFLFFFPQYECSAVMCIQTHNTIFYKFLCDFARCNSVPGVKKAFSPFSGFVRCHDFSSFSPSFTLMASPLLMLSSLFSPSPFLSLTPPLLFSIFFIQLILSFHYNFLLSGICFIFHPYISIISPSLSLALSCHMTKSLNI